ncbi:MAG: glycosyltransferase family 4 protein [Lachnospiraceae bacterium]|nr:glycosyltransferase family 4 protein [Lachnospiraceae bacterium]
MNKKKLLVTGSTFPRWEGDPEPRFVLDLAKNMQDRFDITVLVPADPGAKDAEILEGVKVVRYHYFPIHKWETLCYPGAIAPRIKEKKIRILLVPFLFLGLWIKLFSMRKEFDAAHAHWLIPQGIVHSFIRLPYIVTGHGGDVTSMNGGILKTLKKRCLRRARAITAVSDPLADLLKDMAPGRDVPVLSMGVDTERFGPQYRKEHLFSKEDIPVVLFVGRLAEKKGVRYLIEAMEQVDALLVIVGIGPLKEALEKQAAKAKRAKVVFLGGKTHKELKEIYASADVFAAPSVTAKDGDKEGLGLVILEAMASGLPVAASRSGGIVQVIRHEENGLLSEERAVDEIARNLNRILTDDVLRAKLVKGSYETARAYDYRAQAAKYADLIEKTCM